MDEDSITLKLSSVNAYLLKANDGFVLVDSGFPWQWASLKAALRSEGCVPGKDHTSVRGGDVQASR